jgi:hypothetical protein
MIHHLHIQMSQYMFLCISSTQGTLQLQGEEVQDLFSKTKLPGWAMIFWFGGKDIRSFATKDAIGAGAVFLAEFANSAKSLTEVCLLFLSTDMYLHIAESDAKVSSWIMSDTMAAPHNSLLLFLYAFSCVKIATWFAFILVKFREVNAQSN